MREHVPDNMTEEWLNLLAEHGQELCDGTDGIRPPVPATVDPRQHGSYRTEFGATWVYPFTAQELQRMEMTVFAWKRGHDPVAGLWLAGFVEQILRQLRPLYPWIMENGLDWATEGGRRFTEDGGDDDDPEEGRPGGPPKGPPDMPEGDNPREPSEALTEPVSVSDDEYGPYTDPDCHTFYI